MARFFLLSFFVFFFNDTATTEIYTLSLHDALPILLNLPAWIEVHSVAFCKDAGLQNLDRGEREAIQLAEEQRARLLLIDERLGRSEAKRRGIATTGTLGILLAGGDPSFSRSGAGLSTTNREN